MVLLASKTLLYTSLLIGDEEPTGQRLSKGHGVQWSEPVCAWYVSSSQGVQETAPETFAKYPVWQASQSSGEVDITMRLCVPGRQLTHVLLVAS